MANKEDLLDKGYDEDSLHEIPPVMEVNPTVRVRIWEIILATGLCLFFLSLLNKVPEHGVYLDTVMGIKLKILHIKLTHDFLAWPLRIACLGSFFYGVFVVLQQRLTQYQLNDLNLIFTRGVITRHSDSTDLVAIRDHKLSRTLSDRLLGISRLKIISKDITDPEMDIIGITEKEANAIINFLRRYAYQNYAEMRIAQERARQRKNIKASRPKRDHTPGVLDDEYGDNE